MLLNVVTGEGIGVGVGLGDNVGVGSGDAVGAGARGAVGIGEGVSNIILIDLDILLNETVAPNDSLTTRSGT